MPSRVWTSFTVRGIFPLQYAKCVTELIRGRDDPDQVCLANAAAAMGDMAISQYGPVDCSVICLGSEGQGVSRGDGNKRAEYLGSNVII